jgi:hypothetical protein
MEVLWRAAALFGIFCLSSGSASAGPVVEVTGGAVRMPYGGDAPFRLTAAGTDVNGIGATAARRRLTAGTSGDLNATVTNSSNQPFTETVAGTTYSSVWIKATLAFTTTSFSVPSAPDGTTRSMATPFTMQGELSGYSDSTLTHPVFSVSLSGSGVASIGPMQFAGGEWTLITGGDQLFDFSRPTSSPWTAQDIGSVGQSGVASYSDDHAAFYVAGSGSDIWGTTDAFQFVSQPLAGDGELIARVVTEQHTSPLAKVGIMFRRSLAPDSAQVILDRKPDGAFEFMTRASSGGETAFVAGASGIEWFLKLSRTGSIVTASISTDATAWTLVGSAPLSGPVLVGLVATSHDDTTLNQAIFDAVTLTDRSGTTSSLPQPWRDADIGATGQAGTASASSDVFTVHGAGADIWGASDSFHYVYVPINGAGEARVTVGTLQNTDAYAKAGVMIRASTDPSAAHVILDVKPDGGIEFMARQSNGDETSFIAGAVAHAFPVTLRLRRVAAQVQSLFIADVFDSVSATWQQIGSVAITIPPAALVGMAVTSHDTGTPTTATFSAQIARNLIETGGFEEYDPPALGTPGWVSDTPLRQVDASSETNQPHNGAKNGVCFTASSGDCGMYQDVVIPDNGTYRLTMFATADRQGGLIGFNSNGATVQLRAVEPRGFGNYGAAGYTFDFSANAGQVIRVWMYSPASPGYIAIDDVALVQRFTP